MTVSEIDNRRGSSDAHDLAVRMVNWSLIGGLTAALFSVFGLLLVGGFPDSDKAQKLIEVIAPGMQMLGFATITATGTIMALMMTMLSILHEMKFDKVFYDMAYRIGLVTTIGLVGGVVLLGLVGLPVSEAEDLSGSFFIALYYLLVAANAIISGLLVAIVLMMFDVVRGVIKNLKKE